MHPPRLHDERGAVLSRLARDFSPSARFKGSREALAERAHATAPGDALDPETEFGPLINAAAADRVHGLVDRSLKAGARVLAGGKRDGAGRETLLAHGDR